MTEENTKLNPGDTFIITNKVGCNCDFLIVLLSSDREPGIEYIQDSIFRCAQFQIGSKSRLFGAQIVLYTIPELQEMKKWDNILEEDLVLYVASEKHKRKDRE